MNSGVQSEKRKLAFLLNNIPSTRDVYLHATHQDIESR